MVIFDKDVFNTINTAFFVHLSGKSSPKLALGKISYMNFCKLVQITKKFYTSRQGMPAFDMTLQSFLVICLYFTDYRFLLEGHWWRLRWCKQ